MFGDFNFSSGFSQLANIDISQKFEQIKKDLEANISSHIDTDALSAFTGEGAKGGKAHLFTMAHCTPSCALFHEPMKGRTCKMISVAYHLYQFIKLRTHNACLNTLGAPLHAAAQQLLLGISVYA